MPIPLLVCSGNLGKVREVRAILGDAFQVLDWSVLPRGVVVEETGETFEENATLKAIAGSTVFEGWVVADDSGLEVDVLGGAPGIRSARYAGADATDAANMGKLLDALERIPVEARTARFRCALVIARSGRKLAAFEGSVEGHIALHASGGGGFGYDPVFIPVGHERSFAELAPEAKNQISHRAGALRKLAAWGGWF